MYKIMRDSFMYMYKLLLRCNLRPILEEIIRSKLNKPTGVIAAGDMRTLIRLMLVMWNNQFKWVRICSKASIFKLK